MDEKRFLNVDADRVEQLISALAFASTDMFDHADAEVKVTEDDFGALESAFALFLTELAQAKTELRRAVTETAASRDELQAKLQTIEAQQATIRELSTPILDVAPGVLTLPVVGVIDAQRAEEMTERLLERIVAASAKAVIIDVTGVEVVDTLTADHLVRLTRAAGLVGTRCSISGISPAVARTLVEMGADLSGLKTFRTLRDGLRATLDQIE